MPFLPPLLLIFSHLKMLLWYSKLIPFLCESQHNQLRMLDREFGKAEMVWMAPTYWRRPWSGLDMTLQMQLPNMHFPHLHHKLQFASSQLSLAHESLTNMLSILSWPSMALLHILYTPSPPPLHQGFCIVSSHKTGLIVMGHGTEEQMNIGGRQPVIFWCKIKYVPVGNLAGSQDQFEVQYIFNI